ncbi:general stress protein [Paenibacillus sp. M1]|uniref:General stress protein n=1 Tax=Paenibacillus haidiansis TaxID=1574488 RepID=A0ABU7VQL4_9BACL
MSKKIVGVFDSEREASAAIEALQEQGFTAEEISVLSRDRRDREAIEDETGSKAPEGVTVGATTGGVLGGVAGLLAGLGALAIPGIGPIVAAGPVAASLTGMAAGAGLGGLAGGLIGLGIPEHEAKAYESYLDEGKILVMVDEDHRSAGVYDTFRTNRSLNSDIYASGLADPYREDPSSRL